MRKLQIALLLTGLGLVAFNGFSHRVKSAEAGIFPPPGDDRVQTAEAGIFPPK